LNIPIWIYHYIWFVNNIPRCNYVLWREYIITILTIDYKFWIKTRVCMKKLYN